MVGETAPEAAWGGCEAEGWEVEGQAAGSAKARGRPLDRIVANCRMEREEAHCLKGLIRPFNGLITPLKGLIRPFKGLIRPFKGLIRPFKRPYKALIRAL